MKCVELAKTSPPTAVKDAVDQRHIEVMPAQSAFEKYAKKVKHGRGFLAYSDYSSRTSAQMPRQNVGNKVATLGSDGMVYCDEDNGILSAILAAYNNHWKLRTSPDDWWFSVVKRVSLAINKNAEIPGVRNLFVEHEGKKTLCVDVPTTCIYDVNYR